jgi:hypothetical protein
MTIVQKGGFFQIKKCGKYTFEFVPKNETGWVEVNILRTLFRGSRDTDIIKYILRDNESTKYGKLNNPRGYSLAAHNYQNMNIRFGHNDGRRSDFLRIFNTLDRADRENILSFVSRKIQTREIDLYKPRKANTEKARRTHETELEVAKKQLELLLGYHHQKIQLEDRRRIYRTSKRKTRKSKRKSKSRIKSRKKSRRKIKIKKKIRIKK